MSFNCVKIKCKGIFKPGPESWSSTAKGVYQIWTESGELHVHCFFKHLSKVQDFSQRDNSSRTFLTDHSRCRPTSRYIFSRLPLYLNSYNLLSETGYYIKQHLPLANIEWLWFYHIIRSRLLTFFCRFPSHCAVEGDGGWTILADIRLLRYRSLSRENAIQWSSVM